MAQTWEWGPWAQQGEDFQTQQRKLDLEKQQADAAALRQRMADAAAMARTQASQEGALKNMLAGKAADQSYKIADEDRMAGNAVPFLRSAISGNKQLGTSLGFGTPGELPVPEAGYAGTEPGVRTPTDQELRGIAKAAPTLATTLAQHAIPKPAEPFTLGPGQERFSPTGEPIAKGPAKPGAFPTIDAALAEKARLEAQDPKLVGRIKIDQDSQGNYQIGVETSAPLTPQDPIKDYFDMQKKGVEGAELESARLRMEAYIKRTNEAAGAKTFIINQNTPLTPAEQADDLQLQKKTAAYATLSQQAKSDPQLVKSFLGGYGKANDAWLLASKWPVTSQIVTAMGKDEFLKQYADWKTNIGIIQREAFEQGGKQLTPYEAGVVYKGIINGEESPAEYLAKMKFMDSYMAAQAEYRYKLRSTPRGALDPATRELIWRQAQQHAGIDLTTKDKPYKKFMSSEETLMDDFDKNRRK